MDSHPERDQSGLRQRHGPDALRDGVSHGHSLNASAMAVPVYRHFGFVPGGPLRISDTGLVTQPMHLDLSEGAMAMSPVPHGRPGVLSP